MRYVMVTYRLKYSNWHLRPRTPSPVGSFLSKRAATRESGARCCCQAEPDIRGPCEKRLRIYDTIFWQAGYVSTPGSRIRSDLPLQSPGRAARSLSWPMDQRVRTVENEVNDLTASRAAHEIAVALLTGGGDRHYVFGLAAALMAKGIALDLIGSDDLDDPEFRGKPGVNFLNLRGNQRPDVSFPIKVFRVLVYYAKLIRYAATAKPQLFHILWNNKFQNFDRTVLMLYYRLLGKKVVLTAHNVNAGKRDSNDTRLNRLTLRMQYQLSNHIFVHTKKMRCELIGEFGVPEMRVTVIPYGINNAVPNTRLAPSDAKLRLGIPEGERAILFFGNIAPYKGLEYLVAAFRRVLAQCEAYRLIIAGTPKHCERYWRGIRQAIGDIALRGRVLLRAGFIPDGETELYFKAADVLVLPYTHIYQSGVLFLAYSFGLPVIASDVGSLREDIIEGKTGYVFKSEDAVDLARCIERYFASGLYAELNSSRQEIRDYATQRQSWDVVSEVTRNVYARVLGKTDDVTSTIDSHSCAQHLGTDADSLLQRSPERGSGAR